MFYIPPTDQQIAQCLKQSKTIAVVGLSPHSYRASFGVSAFLQECGYRIIPVNPNYQEILREPCYPDLHAIPEPIDIVDVFRNTKFVPAIVDEAIEIGAHCVWLQLGLWDEVAAAKAQQADIFVIMDKCTKIEVLRFQTH